jgi:CelD/BcsL family acetyltransferase involved in cellulose biosynthesis
MLCIALTGIILLAGLVSSIGSFGALWTRARITTLLRCRQGLTLTTRHKRYKNKDV